MSATSTAAAPASEKNTFCEPGRRALDDARGELDRGHAAQAEQRRVRDAIELRADRVVDLRDAMTVHRHPQRRDAVQVAVAVGVDELEAVRALDDQRVVVQPLLHLRERMPQVGAIEVGEVPGTVCGHVPSVHHKPDIAVGSRVSDEFRFTDPDDTHPATHDEELLMWLGPRYATLAAGEGERLDRIVEELALRLPARSADVTKAVSVFGSARVPDGHPEYEHARRVCATLGRGRLHDHHRRRAGSDGGGEPRRAGRRRAVDRPAHRAAVRAGRQPVRRRPAHVSRTSSSAR